MNKQKDSKTLLVALDIGTSKVVAIVAEIKPDATLEIIGMGSQPSRGLKKGVVVNIESTVNAIQRRPTKSKFGLSKPQVSRVMSRPVNGSAEGGGLERQAHGRTTPNIAPKSAK